MRAIDWDRHPLGPPEKWPSALRTVVGIALGSNQPMLIVWGPEQTTLYNDGYAAMCGARHPAAMGHPFHSLWFDIWDQVEPLIARTYAGESIHMDDIQFTMHRHGYPEETHFAFSYSPVRDESGAIGGMFCACTETTGAVLAQRALREGEERWRSLFERMGEGFFIGELIRDADGRAIDYRFLEINPAFETLTSLSPAATVGRKASEAVPGFDDSLMGPYREVVESGQAGQFELVAPLLGNRWYEVRARPLGDDRFAVLFIEITDRKRTEAALQQTSREAERLAAERSAILGQLLEGVIFTDPAGRISFVNEAAVRLHGVDRLDVEPNAYSDAYHLFTEDGRPYPPEDLPLARAVLQRETVSEARWRIRRPNGTEVLAIGSARPLDDSEGRSIGAVLTIRDDTARDAVEQALRVSEAKARAVIDGAKDHAIFTTDADGVIDGWSEGAEAIFGWTEEEIVGQSAATIFTPEDRENGADVRELTTAAEEGCANDERWHLRKDGSRVFMNGSVRPLRTADGALRGFVKVARDETGRRDAADRLGEVQERLRLATLATNDAIWDWDLLADRVEWNAALGEAYGHERPGVEGAWWLEHIHPDDRDRISHGIHAVIGGKGSRWTDEYRFRRADGDHADVLDRGFVVRDADGRAVRMIGAMLDLTERKRIEAALGESEARFRAITNTIDQMIWSTRPDGFHDFYNQRWYDYTGVPQGSTDGEGWNDMFHPDDQERAWARWRKSLDTGFPYEIEYRLRHRSGDYRWVLGRALPMRDDAGEIVRWFGTCTDIHDRKATEEALRESQAELQAVLEGLEAEVDARTRELQAAEESLRQAQKMEAIGQLTGGIAHDFNNLLTGIIGSLDLIKRRIDAGRVGEIERFMDAATTSANRAAALTHRLLAFARRQSLDTKAVDVNALAASMEDLLQRTIGEQIDLRFELGAGVWQATTDANQLESALLNLAINARDAMPDGGKLTVETANTRLDDSYTAQHQGLQAGDYVVICVSDTGMGMTADVIERAFDPFFTTKPIGQGTGLGLSMIYGFARQSGGHARIYSEPGQGTTVKLYLPRHLGEAAAEAAEAGLEAPRGAGETVLVVEDDSAVRLLVVELLDELGYASLEAHDGPSALPILNSDARIDLMVSDVGLPGLNGRQLAESARAVRPGLKVLFITGYAENAAVRSGFLGPDMEMITKPFAMDTLATKVREMLAGG